MAAMDLDYSSDRHSNWIGRLALAIGAAILISAVWHYLNLNEEISDQEALVSRLQGSGKSRAISPAAETRDAEQIARETKQANAAILALSLPWKDLFEAFEANRTKDVAVLAIEPDAQKRLVHISAEAKNLEGMLDYVSGLQRIAWFRDVVVLNHQIQEQDPQKPVRFVLQAAWEIQH